MSVESQHDPPERTPSKAGIIFVASKVLYPSALDPLAFTDWYEETHIQQVQATGGISSTQRYESLQFHEQYRQRSGANVLQNKNYAFDYLTVYNMPDLAFRKIDTFRNLDGQSKPNEELLNTIFRQAAFNTIFCEEAEAPVLPPQISRPAPFLLSVASRTHSVSLTNLSQIPGCIRMRTFKQCEASLLSEFNRTLDHDDPRNISLYEFGNLSALEAAEEQLKSVQTGDHEVGYWRLRRAYDGTERTPAEWKAT